MTSDQTTPLTDQQLDEIDERLSEARLVADKADWMLQDYQVVRQQQADAAALVADLRRARTELAELRELADRRRSLALLEAAEFVRSAHFGGGMSVQEIGTALAHMSDDADPMVGSLARDGFGPDEIADMLGGITQAEDIAAADNPTPLRWGLNDVEWGDDDTVTVLLSGPNGEPYWLELDPERAAVLRQDLAGPDAEEKPDEPEASTRPCGHDDYHDSHEWGDRPGVWCPGISYADDEAPAPAV